MSWQTRIKDNVTTAEELKDILGLSPEEYALIRDEIKTFPMSVTRYYLSLIDPGDPDDPIRKMAVPSAHSIFLDGDFDTSGEQSNTKIAGVQHKYSQTALILTTSRCAMYCRHCFRRRLVGLEDEETTEDIGSAVQYIRAHPEINNVLLSGGDSFMMQTTMIEAWLDQLCSLDQLDFVRFGTRTIVTFPQRILEDPKLCDVLSHWCRKKQIYVVTHFNHPREMTEEAIRAIALLQNAGIILKNQTVLLRGVNDDSAVLGDLLRKLTQVGIVAHYIFQCRPVKGVKSIFQVPLGEGIEIVQAANAMQNGLGKTADYTMSHVTGKLRILGRGRDGNLIFQYKQAKDPDMVNRILVGDAAGEMWLPEDVRECLSFV